MKTTIKVTVCLDGPFWVGIFERADSDGLAIAKHIFGKEPTDPELYEFVLTNFAELKFTDPHEIKLIIKRKNPQRVQREVRKEMAKLKSQLPSTTLAQDVLRLELEKNKKLKKASTKIEKEAEEREKFRMRQEKKKQKLKGH